MATFDEVFSRPIAVVSSNSRAGGTSVVGIAEGPAWPELDGRRGYVKRQTRYTCRPLWNALRATPTAAREARYLALARARGAPVAEVALHACAAGGRSYLVTRAVDGRALRSVLAGADPRLRERVIDAVARAFVALHRARIVHGALYDTHVLIDRDGRAVLVDLEKARIAPSKSLAAMLDLPRFFRRARGFTRADRRRLLVGYPSSEFPLLALWRVLAR